jgi:short-subunit dehydrogenase
VAVVTGASSGIGRATAEALARGGASVVVAARRQDRLAEVVAGIESAGGRALAVPCDVGDWGQVQSLGERVREAFGRCDILVNNAGVPGGGQFVKLSIEQIEQVVRTNYLGVLYCTREFLPGMLDARRGHVVNVASLAGRFAIPGSSVYTSTKHAVVAFSESLHFEMAPRGVRVTSVNPGVVATETFPHRDMAKKGSRLLMKPERVAEVIVRVVRSGKAPEISVPRSLAALQIFRLLTPPLYRSAMQRVVRRGLRATSVGER